MQHLCLSDVRSKPCLCGPNRKPRNLTKEGYLCPIPVLEPPEVKRFRSLFDAYLQGNAERLAALPGRQKYLVTSQMHFVYKWVYDLITRPRVLDAVEVLVGPDFVTWDTNWFIKLPGDKTFVSWH